jgi:predicted tellurium resistance membrane protein TerC
MFLIFGVDISWRDIILTGGGLFLIAKTTREIHREVEPGGEKSAGRVASRSFATVVAQLTSQRGPPAMPGWQ